MQGYMEMIGKVSLSGDGLVACESSSLKLRARHEAVASIVVTRRHGR